MGNAKTRKVLRYVELPPDVKEAVNAILQHQKQIDSWKRRFGIIYAGIVGAFTPATVGLVQAGYTESAATVATVTAMGVGTATARMWRDHGERNRSELLTLHHRLATSKNPAIRQLMKNWRYLQVNRRGDLVGRKFDPRISFLNIAHRLPTARKDAMRRLVKGRKFAPGTKPGRR